MSHTAYNVSVSMQAGAVTVSDRSALDWYNVKSYGATGNGITDDTAAIQLAVTACDTAGGGTVYFPATSSSYLISSIITSTSDNVSILGNPSKPVIYIATVAASDSMFYFKGDGCSCRNLEFKSPTQTTNENYALNFRKDSKAAVITAVTKANPGVVTSAAHGFADGTSVAFAAVAGMTELNGNSYIVNNATTNTFELAGTDTTGFTTYTSAGTATGVPAILDVTVEGCRFEKLSYGVIAISGTRMNVRDNYFYATGDDSTGTGGAVQVSLARDCHITGNTFTGDSSNRWQHGIYVASQANNLWITDNHFSDGYFSYGCHVYLHKNTSNNIHITNNTFHDMVNAIGVFDTAGDTNTIKNVVISGNNATVAARCVILSATLLEGIRVTDNYFAGGATVKPMLEVEQAASDVLTDLVISNNVFDDWAAGDYAIEIDNVNSVERVTISDNVFKSGSGTALINLDAASGVTTEYRDIKIINNVADQLSVITGDYPNLIEASWMDMRNNSWDKPLRLMGNATPEGAVYAKKGSTFQNIAGGTSATFYIKETGSATVSGITQANPGVVTATAHGFADGDLVKLTNVAGMVEVNDNIYTVANKTTNDFELSATNTTGFTAYTSGGIAMLKVGWKASGASGAAIKYSAKTANYTILESEAGSIFSNAGAAGTVDLILPITTAGKTLRFFAEAAQFINIRAQAGVTIYALPAGGAWSSGGNNAATGLISSVQGDYCECIATNATTWIAVSTTAGWTLAP